MRKPVIVKIQKTRTPGKGTTFKWPKRWIELADIYKAQPVALEDTGSQGTVTERAIGVVDEDVFAYAIADPDISPVDVGQANVLGKQWRPDVTITTDQEEVYAILRKVAKGKKLTADEIAAIDEDAPGKQGVLKKSFDISNFL